MPALSGRVAPRRAPAAAASRAAAPPPARPAPRCAAAAARRRGRAPPPPRAVAAPPAPAPAGAAAAAPAAGPPAGKTRVVVLGSGWAAMSFVKAWDAAALSDRYELTLVSPRNYFVYTPLLPAMCAGTVEERSIVEPVRAVMAGRGRFYEAVAKEVLPAERAVVACFPEDAGFPEACFKVEYDVLVLGVGCVNNTFGIAGVAEHTNFFKSVEDAARLRLRVSECFERASLPGTSAAERRQLLSFVIVGGGPTGVEVAAELHDLFEEVRPAAPLAGRSDHVLETDQPTNPTNQPPIKPRIPDRCPNQNPGPRAALPRCGRGREGPRRRAAGRSGVAVVGCGWNLLFIILYIIYCDLLIVIC
jgi:hypothetical protein